MLGVMKPCEGGNPIPLTKPKLLIGRRSFCDISLRFANVSSRHCELEFTDGFWFARDLDSTNGTTIDGKLCKHDCIRPGSVLAIGRHRFTLEYKAEGEPPPVERLDSEIISGGLLSQAGIEPELDSQATQGQGHGGQLFPVGGGNPIALSRDHLLVGRHRSCDIQLPVKSVSSRHCELEFTEGHWLVRDLGSHNGTKVNGRKVDQQWLLPNCELQISVLRFKVLYRPTPGAPLPKDDGVSFTRSLLERAGLKRRD